MLSHQLLRAILKAIFRADDKKFDANTKLERSVLIHLGWDRLDLQQLVLGFQADVRARPLSA
ncbi:hypothetical protein CCGE525_34220 (plasmid) [Rhizobium jaguaris]|uniref:Uncharacterized protein n=1 Tax=Rhizobium jaguaris TaxID=1312183 RepID=A0A387G020_9HYPH|nr:hypothetical protein CCGE525_34220 [Rhizobium jaguaris]